MNLNKKIKVYHFYNGCGGGIYSVIKNYLIYSQLDDIENHIICTLKIEKKAKNININFEGAATVQLFYYSDKWNFYYTCKSLSSYLPDEHCIIVAHDWLELGMVTNLGLKNKVIQFLHGDFDYYYELSLKHLNNIDLFVCVSNVISKKLKSIITSFEDKVVYLNYPVPKVKCPKKYFDKIKCLYFVRDLSDPRKQLTLLPKIDQILLERSLNIEWHIVGGGMTKIAFDNLWNTNNYTVYFHGFLIKSDLENLLHKCNVYILPSESEGFPVALVESMKFGLVPLISNWNGAVEDIVIHGISGFYAEYQDIKTYSDFIQYLSKNEKILEEMSIAATESANLLFDPNNNTLNFEKLIIQLSKKEITFKRKYKSYGSRLDNPCIPNLITKLIRYIIYR